MNRATFNDEADLWWAALFIVMVVTAVVILGSLWLVTLPVRAIWRGLRQTCE